MEQMSWFGETVDEAKARVRAHLEEGIDCPVCTQLCKQYWRSIYHMQVLRMVELYKHGDEMLALADMSDRNAGEIATLRYWDLVEPEELTREEKEELDRPSRGTWRLTDKGRWFCERKVTVPKYAVVFNNVVEFYEGPEVTIAECCKKDFSFDDLWNGPLMEEP